MRTTNINRALAATHPLDELRIRQVAGMVCVGPLSKTDVERLWTTFSHDRKDANGWLPVGEETLADFGNWMKN
jgi:hypothetical protein